MARRLHRGPLTSGFSDSKREQASNYASSSSLFTFNQQDILQCSSNKIEAYSQLHPLHYTPCTRSEPFSLCLIHASLGQIAWFWPSGDSVSQCPPCCSQGTEHLQHQMSDPGARAVKRCAPRASDCMRIVSVLRGGTGHLVMRRPSRHRKTDGENCPAKTAPGRQVDTQSHAPHSTHWIPLYWSERSK